MNGDTPIDTFEPQFTQREAALVSGADPKQINNWIDRGHLTLTPVKDRRLAGRRLFSVADIAQIQTMDYCGRLIGLSPTVSAQIATAVREYLMYGFQTSPKTPEGKRYKVWHICKRAGLAAPSEASEDSWHLQGVWQHPASGAFYQYDPGVFGDRDFDGFPHFPCVMLPTSAIAIRVFLRCADLLAEDHGAPAGAASEGIDPE